MKMNNERWMALSLALMIILLFIFQGWYTAVIFFVGVYFGMGYMEILMRRNSKQRSKDGS